MKNVMLGAAALALSAPLTAQEPAALAPGEIVAQAKAEEWVAIPADDLLVMTLAPDTEGHARQVVIQLMPAPFSQGWVHNIRLFARSGWYDGISVNRVQDNYVTQWGDPNYDNPEATGKAKPLPAGLKVMGEDAYTVDGETLSEANNKLRDQLSEKDTVVDDMDQDMASAIAEFERVASDHSSTEAALDSSITALLRAAGLMATGEPNEQEKLAMLSIAATQTPDAPQGWHERDSFAEWTEIWQGWPLANREVGQWFDENENAVARPMMPRHEAFGRGFYQEVSESSFWPVHCYGMVGVGRNLSPDTGSGAELYTVIGHAPRHLDRNIAVVGRVIEGMEHLSSLPRGKGALGFYGPDEVHKRTPILTVRVASDLVPAEQPQFAYLSTEGETFARYAEARVNRRDPFFNVPAGGVDICNVPVPVRRAAE